MKKYKFTTAERFAIWTSHKGLCFWCKEPVKYFDTEIDHLLPESLLEDPTLLQDTINKYGLASSFKINDFPNWVPMHTRCNRGKGSAIYQDAPIVQDYLLSAAKQGEVARRHWEKENRESEIMKAAGTLISAFENNSVPSELQQALVAVMGPHLDLHSDFQQHRKGASAPTLPPHQVVSITFGNRHGYVNTSTDADGSWMCPTCQAPGIWQGSRCLVCGRFSDPAD